MAPFISDENYSDEKLDFKLIWSQMLVLGACNDVASSDDNFEQS